ncbi:MAG: hypothetical protein Q8Q29_07960 [Actinomycetota bacterium]|jgi:hypothetical protein|nr:hypothetical protein [Actinomycetota bacterium]
MAQTTWSDSEFRRTFLEGLSALTDGNRDHRQRHAGRALIAGFTVALGVAIAVALF